MDNENIVRLTMSTYEGFAVNRYYGAVKTKKEMALLERAKKYSSDACYVMWRTHTDGNIEATVRFGEFDKDGNPKFDSVRQKMAIVNLLDAWSKRFTKTVQKNSKKKK